MHYVKTFTSGGADHDPRQKKWATYNCDACGYVHDFNITTIYHTFDFERPRKCPECHSFGKDDLKRGLETKLQKKQEEATAIQQEIERIIFQIEKIEVSCK